jgi:hypothetical protein
MGEGAREEAYVGEVVEVDVREIECEVWTVELAQGKVSLTVLLRVRTETSNESLRSYFLFREGFYPIVGSRTASFHAFLHEVHKTEV